MRFLLESHSNIATETRFGRLRLLYLVHFVPHFRSQSDLTSCPRGVIIIIRRRWFDNSACQHFHDHRIIFCSTAAENQEAKVKTPVRVILARVEDLHDSFHHVSHDGSTGDIDFFDTWHTIGTRRADIQKHYRFFQLNSMF